MGIVWHRWLVLDRLAMAIMGHLGVYRNLGEKVYSIFVKIIIINVLSLWLMRIANSFSFVIDVQFHWLAMDLNSQKLTNNKNRILE